MRNGIGLIQIHWRHTNRLIINTQGKSLQISWGEGVYALWMELSLPYYLELFEMQYPGCDIDLYRAGVFYNNHLLHTVVCKESCGL